MSAKTIAEGVILGTSVAAGIGMLCLHLSFVKKYKKMMDQLKKAENQTTCDDTAEAVQDALNRFADEWNTLNDEEKQAFMIEYFKSTRS